MDQELVLLELDQRRDKVDKVHARLELDNHTEATLVTQLSDLKALTHGLRQRQADSFDFGHAPKRHYLLLLDRFNLLFACLGLLFLQTYIVDNSF